MKIRAAVLYEQGKPLPYAESRPLVVEEVDLDGPGPGEVLVQNARLISGLYHRPGRLNWLRCIGDSNE